LVGEFFVLKLCEVKFWCGFGIKLFKMIKLKFAFDVFQNNFKPNQIPHLPYHCGNFETNSYYIQKCWNLTKKIVKENIESSKIYINCSKWNFSNELFNRGLDCSFTIDDVIVSPLAQWQLVSNSSMVDQSPPRCQMCQTCFGIGTTL